MNQFERLNALLDTLEKQLSQEKIDPRAYNLSRISTLYQELELSKQPNDFETIFDYKAMNLTGLSLQDEDFAAIRAGRYVQIICISYQLNDQGKRVSQNSSLGYFGKAEKLTEERKNQIIEFILRWRYEKAFRHADIYEQLLSKLI